MGPAEAGLVIGGLQIRAESGKRGVIRGIGCGQVFLVRGLLGVFGRGFIARSRLRILRLQCIGIRLRR